MSDSLFSPLWYRVAELRPRLRQHVEMHRHEYRGLIWYILEDKSSGRNHRFSSSAYKVVGMLDGKNTVNQIWESVNIKLGDFAPTQDEIIQLLGKLHESDLLQSEVAPDTEELFQRNQKQKSAKIKNIFKNPLSQKIPLWDPDDFLERFLPWVNWSFHWVSAVVWLLVVGTAVVFAGIYWDQLILYMMNSSFSPYNFIALCVVYPVVKLLHELGHAFATKRGGGEVHEMGVMFLVFMPIPFVNASASATFRSKYKRILVAAAGILVELFLAAVGFWFWLNIESGLIKDLAFNVMLIGGVSSLFFNGNPLLRFDGYYVFADMVGIPNLYQRSTQYLAYLCQRRLFGMQNLSSPASTPGEARWFFFYAIGSFLYRMGVLWVIIIFVTDKLFVVGIMLALWMVTVQLIMPLIKIILFITTNPSVQRQRNRAVSVSLAMIVVSVFMLTAIPIPSSTRAEGVVWLPEDAHLRSESDGFIEALLAQPNDTVLPNAPLIKLSDPFSQARVKVLESKLNELKVKYLSKRFSERVESEIIKQELNAVKADLKRARQKQKSTIVRSTKQGELLIASPEDQLGRFVRQGELVGYVVDGSEPTARVVVKQDDIGKVRESIDGVEIRLANQINRVLPARILREVPEAGNKLPSTALSTTGGGQLSADPSDPDGLTAMEKFFQFDIEFSAPIENVMIGSRVYVRFDHGTEPVAHQVYRRVRQLFLKQFDV